MWRLLLILHVSCFPQEAVSKFSHPAPAGWPFYTGPVGNIFHIIPLDTAESWRFTYCFCWHKIPI